MNEPGAQLTPIIAYIVWGRRRWESVTAIYSRIHYKVLYRSV